MRSRFAILPFLSLLTLANCAETSAVPDGAIIPPETIKPYADWVQQAMKVDMVSLPITTASGWRLKTSLGLVGTKEERVMAAYLPGQIILNNVAWDPRSLASQSYLVHELVHHAQLIGGKRYPCEAAKDREAYTLQNRWLVEHGDKPLISEDFINKISACPNEQVSREDRYSHYDSTPQ